jgi:hypothetical protein
MSSQVTNNLQNATRLQARGNITAARNCAIRAWIEAGVAHSIPTTSPSLNPVLLFPEHDALHFFAWNTATELVYIDLSRNSVKLAWRASLAPTEPPAASPLVPTTNASAPYTFVREEVVLHEDGVRPVITKPLVFFEVEYNTFGGLLYGRVKKSGDFISLGRDAQVWHYTGSNEGGVNRGGVVRVNNRWVAWPTVRSIPGERDGFAELDRLPAEPAAVSHAGEASARLARQYIEKGDLTAARNAALAAWSKAEEAWRKAGIPGCSGGDGDTIQEVYVFPEGQALRFFETNLEGRIMYIEICGDSVALVWAADLLGGGGRRFVFSLKDERMVLWPSNLMPRVPYRFIAGSAISREVGRMPAVENDLVFFDAQGAVGDLVFGRIPEDGMLRGSGNAKMTFSDGHYKVVPIPDERVAQPADIPR